MNHVSLGGVAAAIGLTKSNVMRYFGTREEIYLELAAEGRHEWRSAVLDDLTPVKVQRADFVTDFVNTSIFDTASPTSCRGTIAVGDHLRAFGKRS